MKKYRYILNGCVLGINKICDYRLIAGNNIKPSYNDQSAIRVNIPDDLKLEKWSCDSYSTTEDKRTIEELGYDIIIWNANKKRWIKHNEFKTIRPCDFPFEIEIYK